MIEEINSSNIKDMNRANQPFDIIGKFLPAYQNGEWTYSECLFDSTKEKCYPDEKERYEDYIDNPDQTIFFCYELGECAGQIRIKKYWNKNAYISDIAVAKDFRGRGVGTQLMDRAVQWARDKNLGGIMLESQDNNLLACRFYVKYGFKIGGVDTMQYANFSNADEKAIFWYLKF